MGKFRFQLELSREPIEMPNSPGQIVGLVEPLSHAGQEEKREMLSFLLPVYCDRYDWKICLFVSYYTFDSFHSGRESD